MSPTDSPPPQGTSKATRRIRALGVVVFTVLAVWTGLWFYGAGRVRAGLEQQLAALPGGTSASCHDMPVAGFPFRFDVTCAGVRMTSGDLSISLPEIKATMLVYNPTQALVFAQGPADIKDAFTGSHQQLTWQTLRASARSNGWALARISIVGDDARLADILIGNSEIAHAGHFELHLAADPDRYDQDAHLSGIDFFAQAEGARLPGLNIDQGRLTLEADLPSLPDDMRQWTPEALAAAWRQNPLNLVGLDATDPQSTISIVGTTTLGDDNRLNGDFDLNTTNVIEPLSKLAGETILKVFLGDANTDGSRYRAYALRHGVLMAGNVPVATLPPLF